MAAVGAGAEEGGAAAPTDDPQAKITLGLYRAGDTTVEDLNLRHQFGNATAWVGAYRNELHEVEGRAGGQYSLQHGLLLAQPMVQVGTTGFVQGAVYSEIGGKIFAVAGFSRTNLKPQDDITFDPNNSLQLGAGGAVGDKDRLTAWILWDDRLHTRQQMTHAIWKHRLHASSITIDAFYKSGMTDGGRFIHAVGGGVYYDHGWFVKLYVDPHASFGDALQARLSLGKKF